MTLNQAFSRTNQAIAAEKNRPINNQTIISLLDLTLLDEHATENDIRALQKVGAQNKVAALCILPKHLSLLKHPLPVKSATVINFPAGNDPHTDILSNIIEVIANYGVDEIDYVFPYQTYLDGNHKTALAQCERHYQFCKQHGVLFKVILETGALPNISCIYQLSRDIIHHGCDFIKTSTGKISTGATKEAAFAMLTAIKDAGTHCGFKASGGIKTKTQALDYIQLAEAILEKQVNSQCFRIGASSLINELSL